MSRTDDFRRRNIKQPKSMNQLQILSLSVIIKGHSASKFMHAEVDFLQQLLKLCTGNFQHNLGRSQQRAGHDDDGEKDHSCIGAKGFCQA